jgi:cell wall-associated NlpC family hydrolase
MTSVGYHPRSDQALTRGSLAIGCGFAVVAVLAVTVVVSRPDHPGASSPAAVLVSGPTGAPPERADVPGFGPVGVASVAGVVATCTRIVVDVDELHTALLTSTKDEVLCLRGPDHAPTALSAVAFARAALGTPYVWGGNGRRDGGFDCSGLTTAAYATAGVRLPRTAQWQYNTVPHLAAGAEPEAGDLVFFGSGPRSVTHVGIAISATDMINAPRRGEVVKIAPLRRADLVGIGRPTDMVTSTD